jgi:hypothetical protein
MTVMEAFVSSMARARHRSEPSDVTHTASPTMPDDLTVGASATPVRVRRDQQQQQQQLSAHHAQAPGTTLLIFKLRA